MSSAYTCMAFHTTLQLMLVSDGHSESDYKLSYDQSVMLSIPFPVKGTMPIQYSNMATHTGNVHT